MHDLGFPLGTGGGAVDQAFTEGDGDLGLDGVALAVGNQEIIDQEQARKVVLANPAAPIRILLLQAKRRGEGGDDRDLVSGQDVAKFSMDAIGWLQNSQSEVAARMGKYNNAAAWRQWGIYDAIRATASELKRDDGTPAPFAPEIWLMFVYSGRWTENDTPVQYSRRMRDSIQRDMPSARVDLDIWGAQDLDGAAQYARIGLKRQLRNVALLDMPPVELPARWINGDATPNRSATCFLGYMRVNDLLDALSRNRRGSKELDYRFFLDNPRFFLRLERTKKAGRSDDWNRGARSIEAAIKDGLGGVLGLGHNGVMIVAREARRSGSTLQLVDPQVVNGCQSCFTLDELRDELGDAFLTVRVVVTDNEDLTTFIVRATNTQAPLDEWDLTLGRAPEVLALQRAFMHGLSDAPDRVWLQRRWNDPIGEMADFRRTVDARELLEASAASLFGGPHGDPKELLGRIGADLFLEGHEPNAYRAAAWLFIAYEKWAASNRRQPNLKGARYQVVYALWRLTDDTPDLVALARGRETQLRFQKLIDRLVEDASGDHQLAGRAASCVEGVWNRLRQNYRDLNSAARSDEFTRAVREAADGLRN